MNKFLFWCLAFVYVFDWVFMPILLVFATLAMVVCVPVILAVVSYKAIKDGPMKVFSQLKGCEA